MTVVGQSGGVILVYRLRCENKLSLTKSYPNIVVLTGAGISAESGLRTFRDSDGLWEQHRIEDVATPEAFERDPNLVYAFYNARREQLLCNDVSPNQAHFALAELEKKLGNSCLVATQNVDNLHERAGTKNILHIHGLLNSARCCVSGKSQPIFEAFDHSTPCACCVPAAKLRPDIVWFGEMPLYMDEITEALFKADIFVSIGTSGNVYPAAGFVQQAAEFGARTIEINLEESANNLFFEQCIQGLATHTVPKYVEALFRELGIK